MNIFKSGTLTWWQAGIFKISVFSLGLVVGAHWPSLFVPYTWPLLILALLCGGYITKIWFK